MRIVVVIVLSLVFAVSGSPDWLLQESVPDLCKSCSYLFFHANIFHLTVNCISLMLLYRPNPYRNWRTVTKEITVGYAISIVAWYTASVPIVGISNYLFAVVGLRTPPFRFKEWWLSTGTKTFIIVMLLMLLIPKFSAVTHIVSFSLGVALARLWEEGYGR